ncbi:MAG: imidazolonepropionase [Candidatus Eiseniibacteriota bacterium]
MKRARADGAIVHAAELTVGLDPASPAFGPGFRLERYADGAVAWLDGEVVEAGPTEEVLDEWEPELVFDASGHAVTAGLVDAHTHLVFGGDRAGEFEKRLAGASYEEIAKRGGGILSTVTATRAASDEELLARATATAWRMLEGGVTTIEAKSGYDLTREGELRLLALGARVRRETPLSVIGTVLAAHVVPPEYRNRREAYLEEVAIPVAIEAQDHGHAEFVDAFIERGSFEPADARRLAKAARDAHLALRLHVDQLSDGGGAKLAADLGSVSADHLDHASEAGIAALARAGTVAVLLPGATLTLGGPVPPLASLRAHSVPTAIATDYNPGTSTVDSLVLCMGLACRLYRMTPDEALIGATEAAARALRRAGRIGCLRPGADADIVIWDAPDARTLSYHMGAPLARDVFRRGKRVITRDTQAGEPALVR